MNTQTKITAFAFMLALFWISYWLVCQSNAKDSERYLELLQEKNLLEQQIQEESDSWWVDEDAKNECIQSFTNKQNDRKKINDKRRIRVEQIDNEMGLIESSQAQKKNKLLNNSEIYDLNTSWSIMNDTADETEDNRWYKKLLKWVGWN